MGNRARRQSESVRGRRPATSADMPASARRRRALHWPDWNGQRVLRWISCGAFWWGIIAVGLAIWYLRQRFAAVGGIWISTADLGVDGETTVESVRCQFFWILVLSSVVLFIGAPLLVGRAAKRIGVARGLDAASLPAGWLFTLWAGLWMAQLLWVVAWFVPAAAQLAGWEAVPPLILVPVAIPAVIDARVAWLASVCLAAIAYELVVIELYVQIGRTDTGREAAAADGPPSGRFAAMLAVIGVAIPTLLATVLYVAAKFWFSGE